MFDRYTDEAKRVLFFARREAGDRGAQSIDTPDLLVGLLHEYGDMIDRVFRPSTSVDEVDAQIRSAMTRSAPISDTFNMPVAPEVTAVLLGASDEAQALGSSEVHPEHLLLAIARDEGTIAGRLLANAGVGYAVLRARLLAMDGDE